MHKVDNHQRQTSFRLVPAINQKNYFTGYLKRDNQLLASQPRPDDVQFAPETTVVLHLGSRYLRVGCASDVFPREIPLCIAKPKKDTGKQHDPREGDVAGWQDSVETVEADFRERMRFYKINVVSNAIETCRSFNSRQKGEVIDDDSDEGSENLYGDGALNADSSKFDIVWLFQQGGFTEDPCYVSTQEYIDDLTAYLKWSIPRSPTESDVVLLVPDLFDRTQLSVTMAILFDLGFRHQLILQESVAATFGAGISSACVVDVGSQTTKIACVDEGVCVSDSRLYLDIGGDDITATFRRMLSRISFPAKELSDEDASRLKRKFCTANNEDLEIQLYSATAAGRKFDFKIYNEVMLPVLGLFYPQLFQNSDKRIYKHRLFPRAIDPYENHLVDQLSDAQLNVCYGQLAVNGQSYVSLIGSGLMGSAEPASEPASEVGGTDDEESKSTPAPEAAPGKAGSSQAQIPKAADQQIKAEEHVDPCKALIAPLDHAIVESITQATKSGTSPKTFYENVLVVGGGANISGFHNLLSDRLSMWAPKVTKDFGEIAVLPIPRELDPASILWKGAAVYSRLKIAEEMWISRREWEILGIRILYQKALFVM